MFRLRWFSAIACSVIVIVGCGKRLPEMQNIDMPRWIADNRGCTGYRKQVIAPLQQEKDKLLALNELEIVELLGRPDENELYKRNQKFYYYYLTPARQFCDDATDTTQQSLVIRFNAMGLAKEVAIE